MVLFQRSSCIGSVDMSTVQSVAQKKTMGGGRQFEIITATKSYHFVRMDEYIPGHLNIY